MEVVPFSESDAGAWDALVESSPTGTFQHSRRFLSYHRDRFEDRSILLLEDGKHVAVMPVAVDPSDPSCVTSHPGATYGGLVYAPRTHPEGVGKMLSAACDHFRRLGFRRILYRAVPPHLHPRLSQADVYAVWRCGGVIARRELWNVIDLLQPRDAGGRKRSIRRAERRGVRVDEDNSSEAYGAFHSMLAARLAERHSVNPVHTLDEMMQLRELLPDRVSLWIGCGPDGAHLAGTWIFDLRPAAFHAQYGAASDRARESQALDLVLDRTIDAAAAAGARWFSFGSSTEAEGTILNSGLFSYKASFGSGSVTHDSYKIELAQQ